MNQSKHFDESKEGKVSVRLTLIATCALLVVVFLGAYAIRGWVRKTAFPAIVPLFARNSINTAMSKGVVSLQAAGVLTEREASAKRTMTCSLDRADSLYMAAVCDAHAASGIAAGVQSDAGLRRAVERLKRDRWAIASFDTPTASYTHVQVYALRDYGSTHCTLTMAATPKSVGKRMTYEGTTTLDCYRSIAIF